MDFSIRRVRALCKKELKDLGKNKNVMLMCLLPIIFCFIYVQVGNSAPKTRITNSDVLTLCLNMNLTLVSCFVISMLIAEEKEKNTLRTLMMSSVSPIEFLFGKAISSLILSVIINVVMFYIVGMDTKYLGGYVLFTTLVVISMLGLGAVIGLIAKNQMSTGVVGMPLLMIIMMVPMFADINSTVKKAAQLLPNYNLFKILDRMFKGKAISIQHNAYGISVILIWIVVAGGIFAITYAKKGLDE